MHTSSLRLGFLLACIGFALVGCGGGSSSSTPASSPSAASSSAPVLPLSNNSSLALHVSGDHFVDGNGNTVQLRGANVSGLEFVAVDGWDPSNPWGSQTGTATPNWSTIKSWGINVVRLPLNEASWLGLSCIDEGGLGTTIINGAQVQNTAGTMVQADPGGNYQATVAAGVASATAAGLYVILDLHWTAPATACPMVQNPMADADHSIAFWTSIATTFKNYPNVLFELFNEPFLFYLTSGETNWSVLLNGGTETEYVTGGTPYTINQNWQAAGMQQMLNAVRATGATNVVLVSSVAFASDLSQWLTYKPTDSLSQMAAVWHAYPGFNQPFGSAAYDQPAGGAVQYTYAQAILTAGIPVLITEYGDHNAPGTTSAPFASNLLPWADTNGVGYLGWTWDVWGNADNVLITDAAGDPTAGFGVYVKAHYLCRAAGTTNCP